MVVGERNAWHDLVGKPEGKIPIKNKLKGQKNIISIIKK
jgi:hypothetical protein